MNLAIPLSDVLAQDRLTVGGKGTSLAIMYSRGLPVPVAFCVSTEAFRPSGRDLCNEDLTFLTQVREAYHQLGGGRVAVRSSATWEDSDSASFAGQQQTFMNVKGEEALFHAIQECGKSLSSSTSMAYRARMAVEESSLEMAVVVQRMVDAEVAGVLFTQDPLEQAHIRIEASWGLGEAVVAGKVMPDQYLIDRHTKQVIERHAGTKHIRVGTNGEETVSADQQRILCLDDQQLSQLVELGEKVEKLFDSPRDIEWAYADGQFWLLQARPIATGKTSDREAVRQQVIQEVANLAMSRQTVWSRTRSIEGLPHPTPMTWALVSGKLLSGTGGTGQMYRDLGYHPAPFMADISPYDLIAGRPYLNLEREPYLQAAKPDFHYPLKSYQQQPHLALDPKPATSLWQWLRLPAIISQSRRISSLSTTFAEKFVNEVVPRWCEEIGRAKSENLTQFDLPKLHQRFTHWVDRTLVDFARESLKPTLLADFTQQSIQQRLARARGIEKATEQIGQLSRGAKIEPAANLVQAWMDLSRGALGPEEFLQQFGHRGQDEMELASPRWEEDSSGLDKLPPSLNLPSKQATLDPDRIADEAKWDRLTRTAFKQQVELFQRYLGLRETGKHYLMQGYREIRRTLLEIDRRCHLNGDIFFLQPDEFSDLLAGRDLMERINQRKRRSTIERTLELPSVLLASDLEAIGRVPPPPPNSRQFQGTTISSGSAIGKALVLSRPGGDVPRDSFILVCPSTDPSWVPFFASAKGLVMEVGGMLSHGAIVAREFGLPAVAGLPGILQQIRTGQMLQVDGMKGIVSILEDHPK